MFVHTVLASYAAHTTESKYSYYERRTVAMQINPATLPAPVPWPSIHVPWYGYLFWTVAAAGGYGKTADTAMVPVKVESSRRSTLRSASCTANIKVCTSAACNQGPGLQRDAYTCMDALVVLDM
jgi:hypothetical protein